MTHTRGVGDDRIHRLAWDAFVEGTAVAKEQGLYGAGQDLLKDAFSGNVRGMGPAVAEMEVGRRRAHKQRIGVGVGRAGPRLAGVDLVRHASISAV